MKTFHHLTSLAQPFRRLRFAALAGVAITLAGTAGAFDPNATVPTVTNAISRFPITVDGRFTPIFSEGGPQAVEWSDITPQAFVITPTGGLFRTSLDDPNAGSFVYTSLDSGVDALYLMYDFTAMQVPLEQFHRGQTLAQVKFGVHLPTNLGGTPDTNTPIVVRFVVGGGIIGAAAAAAPAAIVIIGGTQVNVVFDVDIVGGQTNVPGFVIGLEGAVSFGSSPNSATPHLQAELGVGLRIPVGFGTPGGPFPGNGINPATGLYDPAPKFWGSGFKASPADPDPAASANKVTINPDGSVTVNSGADAGAGFVPFAIIDARKLALDKVKALRAAATDPSVQRRLDEIIRDQQAASYPALYLDQARLAPRGGTRVFDIDEDTLEDLRDLIRRVPATPLALALQKCVDKLIGIDGEFARVAINDAIAAHKDAQKIARALAELARGDADAAANRNESAVDHYAAAWAAVTRSDRHDDNDDSDHGHRN